MAAGMTDPRPRMSKVAWADQNPRRVHIILSSRPRTEQPFMVFRGLRLVGRAKDLAEAFRVAHAEVRRGGL